MDLSNLDRRIPECSFYASFNCEQQAGDELTLINKGCIDYGQAAFIGKNGKHTPVLRADGIKGCAYDGRMMEEKTFGNAPQWGQDGQKTSLGEAINSARSFTATFWLKTAEVCDQGRIFKTPAFQLNYRGDYMELGFGKPKKWYRSDAHEPNFASQQDWVFAAITFKMTADSKNELIYYYATRYHKVQVDSRLLIEDGPSGCSQNNCFLVIGNSEADGNRPFVGSIDEFRLWLSPEKDKAVLTREQIETIRNYDLRETN